MKKSTQIGQNPPVEQKSPNSKAKSQIQAKQEKTPKNSAKNSTQKTQESSKISHSKIKIQKQDIENLSVKQQNPPQEPQIQAQQSNESPKIQQTESQIHRQKPEIQELSNFIVDYVSTMVGIGTYSSRVNRCAKRIAESFGYELSLNFSFNHTLINIVDPLNPAIARTYVVNNKYSVVDFKLISNLSALSWAIYDHINDLRVAQRSFAKLVAQEKHPFYFYIILQSLATASVSILFSGDFATMFIVFISAIFGTSVKTLLSRAKIDLRIIYIICAFLSSYVAMLGTKFIPTNTSDIAIAASMLYLTPGVFFINSIIDILKNYIQMGLSRITSVIVLISCMGIGLYLTISIWDFGFVQTDNIKIDSFYRVLMDMGFAAVVSLGFAYASNPPVRILFLSALCAALGHSFRLLLMEYWHIENLAIATFFASFLIGCLGMFLAKFTKTPAEIIAFPALLPMIPVTQAYRVILYLFGFINADDIALKSQYLVQFFDYFFTTLSTALALAVGVSVTLLIFFEQSFMTTRHSGIFSKYRHLKRHKIKG